MSPPLSQQCGFCTWQFAELLRLAENQSVEHSLLELTRSAPARAHRLLREWQDHCEAGFARCCFKLDFRLHNREVWVMAEPANQNSELCIAAQRMMTAIRTEERRILQVLEDN